MKSSSYYLIVLSLIALTSVEGAIFSIDLSGGNIKSCYLGGGKDLFNIVESSEGKRTIPTGVSFFNIFYNIINRLGLLIIKEYLKE